MDKLMGNWEYKKTGVQCDCGFSDMQVSGMTPRSYPKYKCPICKSSTDHDPKNERLRQRIDRSKLYAR